MNLINILTRIVQTKLYYNELINDNYYYKTYILTEFIINKNLNKKINSV